jgi:hypothetical protein
LSDVEKRAALQEEEKGVISMEMEPNRCKESLRICLKDC